MYQSNRNAGQLPPGVRKVVIGRGRPRGITVVRASGAGPAGRRRIVVVRRNKKDQRNKLLVPLIAGAALLGTGGTLGLWYSSTHFDGVAITAGNLDLAISENLTWYDVSPDRTDSNSVLVDELNELTLDEGFYNAFYNLCTEWEDGHCVLGSPPAVNPVLGDLSLLNADERSVFTAAHLIDCIGYSPAQPPVPGQSPVASGCEDKETWKMVPGDTIVGLIKARLVLEGDNLVAGLEYECDDLTVAELSELGTLVTGDIADLVSVKTDLYVTPANQATRKIDMYEALGGAAVGYLGYFEAPGDGQLGGVLDADWRKPTGSATPGVPVVTTLGSNSLGSSVGEGEVTLMITIHFSENADEQQLATLPLAQIFSGRLALSQVRGADTPGQFIQTP